MNRLENFVKTATANFDESHDYAHAIAVRDMALQIAKNEHPVPLPDEEILATAAMVHDVCDHKYKELSIKKEELEAFLLYHFDGDDSKVSRVLWIVNNVSWKKQITNPIGGSTGGFETLCGCCSEKVKSFSFCYCVCKIPKNPPKCLTAFNVVLGSIIGTFFGTFVSSFFGAIVGTLVGTMIGTMIIHLIDAICNTAIEQAKYAADVISTDNAYLNFVRDADRIMAIGLENGIRRCKAYAFAFEENCDEDKALDHVINHCHEKLLRLYPEKFIITKTARTIAKPLHEETQQWVNVQEALIAMKKENCSLLPNENGFSFIKRKSNLLSTIKKENSTLLTDPQEELWEERIIEAQTP